jgi:type I restriction enzyme S subunit
MPRADMNEVLEFDFPLPPLPEQRRIVGILDQAFEGIAKVQTNTEKNLHLQNALPLYESYLESVFANRGAKWERVTLETLLERGWIESHLDGNHGSDYPRKHEFTSEGVPYISANCLESEQVDMSRAKYLSPARAAKIHKGIAKDRDVLFAHNATVGPVAILRTDEEKVILGTSLTYYRCTLIHILPEYLAHYMRSFAFKAQYLQVMRQSTRNQVPITKQREFYHVIPTLDEQKWIISALNGLFEHSQRLGSLYKQKLGAVDELKKSLLHRAFTGNL